MDEGYRVRLFLEAFGVKAALLNAQLPLNSRSHILQSFNKGLFDTLIATGAAAQPMECVWLAVMSDSANVDCGVLRRRPC